MNTVPLGYKKLYKELRLMYGEQYSMLALTRTKPGIYVLISDTAINKTRKITRIKFNEMINGLILQLRHNNLSHYVPHNKS